MPDDPDFVQLVALGVENAFFIDILYRVRRHNVVLMYHTPSIL